MRADAAFLLPLETPPSKHTGPSFDSKCRSIGDQLGSVQAGLGNVDNADREYAYNYA